MAWNMAWNMKWNRQRPHARMLRVKHGIAAACNGVTTWRVTWDRRSVKKKASACGMNCFTFRLLRGMDGTLFSGPETSWNNQKILKRSKKLSVISVPTPILSGSLCRQQDAAQLHLWHRMSTSTPAQYCNIEPPPNMSETTHYLSLYWESTIYPWSTVIWHEWIIGCHDVMDFFLGSLLWNVGHVSL